MTQTVVVVGAGVIGLSTAIMLLEKAPYLHCIIVAEHLPGENLSIEYTSPWAGAHIVTHAKGGDKEIAEMDMESFGILQDMMNNGETDSLMPIDQFEYYMAGADNGSDPEGLRLCRMPKLRSIPALDLPPDVVSGVHFRSITLNTPSYLSFLQERFLRLGGTILKRKVNSLREASQLSELPSEPVAAINCTGLGAMHLSDVRDESMFPTRGQLCIIRAPWMKYGKTYIGRGWTSYSIPRSSGLVVLGGTREENDWEAEPRPDTTQVILERAVRFDRNLLPPEKRESGTWRDLDIVEEGCGRRPSRKGGLRREIDEDTIPGTIVLHHYGHGGSGYQNSWGSARRAIDMLLPRLPIPSIPHV